MSSDQSESFQLFGMRKKRNNLNPNLNLNQRNKAGFSTFCVLFYVIKEIVIKGAVRRKIFYLILILFRNTFHMRKNSVLTKSISHHVPEIFRFL